MLLSGKSEKIDRQNKKKRAKRRISAFVARNRDDGSASGAKISYQFCGDNAVVLQGEVVGRYSSGQPEYSEFWTTDSTGLGVAPELIDAECSDRSSNEADVCFVIDAGTDVFELWALSDGRSIEGVGESPGKTTCDMQHARKDLELDNRPNVGFQGLADSADQLQDHCEHGDEHALTELDSQVRSSQIKSVLGAVTASACVEGADFEVTEGAKFNRNIASFDVGAGLEDVSGYCAWLDWGDGSKSRGTIVRDGARLVVAGGHVYAQQGAYAVICRIRTPLGLECEATSGLLVQDANVNVGGHFVRATVGREFTGVLAHLRDQNPFSQLSDFSAKIWWGDGSSGPGRIVVNLDGGYDVLGTHTFRAPGKFSAQVQALSRGRKVSNAHASLRVDPVSIMPRGLTAVAVVNSESRLAVAAFDDSDRRASASLYTATVDWADGTTSKATVEPGPSGGFRVIGTHKYDRPGSFSVRVAISDAGGFSVSTIGVARVIS